jgi:UDP-N-acetylmuramate--alanine ligase
MSGIAKILHEQGCYIQGSDIKENQNIKALQALGIQTFIGHKSQNLNKADIVIKSSAVKPANPELKYANEKKLTILSRADILEIILKDSFNIAITGAHGKTSTTALVYYMLQHLEPSLLCGGILNKLNSNAVFGKKDFFVVEADESDATFLKIPTNISIITNIDSEHLDYYGNISNILSSFTNHIRNMLENGLVIACIDCTYIAEIHHEFANHQGFVSYGLYNKQADIRAINISFTNGKVNFDIELSDEVQGILSLNSPCIQGFTCYQNADHELSNLLPAIFTALYHNLDVEQINNIMTEDIGVARRFSIIKKHNNITYIDDYAHHPKEIAATLQKAHRLLARDAKMIVIFQPHKYSRLAELYQDFLDAFKNISHVMVLDVFAAGERRIPNINAAKFVEDLQNKFAINASYAKNITEIHNKILASAKPQDYILFIGAGNISNFAHQIVDKISS